MQQQGGSQYGVPPPEMGPPFSSSSSIMGIPTGVDYLQQPPPVAEAASPINSRPAPQPALPRHQVSIFDDFGSAAGSMAPSFTDEEALAAGEDAERGAGAGNRWPRQETLALLKIRSDMDATFRDATLKGPLWEDVSRKLAELGYSRSAKKCKEKFENVHKYYKRTKEGRAGRQDGKSYRFFTQLEALHSSNGGAAAAVSSLSSPPNTTLIPNPITSPTGSAPPQLRTPTSILPDRSTTPTLQGSRIQPLAAAPPPASVPAPPSRSMIELSNPTAVVGISFSSNTSSSSASESDGEETEEGGVGALNEGGRRKRKREGWPGGSRKMMAFFDGLMKQVIERQEVMQQRFLETIEKREQDRMIREEAWKRQEMARLNREYELMAQERAMAANRDAAVISFLQKFTGSQANQPVAAPISAETPPEEAAVPRPPPPTSPQEKLKPPAAVVEAPTMQIETNISNQLVERNDFVINPTTSSSEPAAAASEMGDGMCVGSLETISPSSASSRWPKPEVLALIKLRSGLESRYLETGPKGPLWEEISLGMKKLGYNRNSKRCKEKWENINKYFKKVKESNKKRTEDAKTCPYFHELDALYRKKQLFGGAANPGVPAQQHQELAITQKIGESLHSPAPITGLTELEANRAQKNPIMMRSSDGRNHESGGVQIPRSNGAGLPQLFFAGAPNRGSSTAMKKPEDIVRELMGQQNLQHRAANDYDKLGGGETVDSDTINHDYDDDEEDNDDEDEDDDEEEGRYEIQFQRQAVGAASGGARSGNSTGKVTATAAASSAGSFLAMVQ